jgi:hypothetical protein
MFGVHLGVMMLMVFLSVNAGFARDARQEGGLPGSIEGTWLGTLDTGGKGLRLVFKIKKNPDGGLMTEMDSIDQGMTGIPVDEVHFREGVLKIQILSINAAYEGKFNDKISAFEGKWAQGAVNLPLLLKAVDKAPELPFRYRREPVKPDAKIYDQYVGLYRYKPGKIFRIIKEDNRLYSQYKQKPLLEVFPESETKFFFRAFDGDITFIKNNKGKVVELIYRIEKKNLRAVKIE